MRRLLAALDFSPVSDAVLAQASALAEAFGAELTLLHVAAPDPDFVGYEAGPDTEREGRAHELRGEHRRLQDTADALRARGLTVHALLVSGPTVDTILEQAGRHASEAIVVGSHGHGAFYRAFLGSVSEGILRGARCPVLVIPATAAGGGARGSQSA